MCKSFSFKLLQTVYDGVSIVLNIWLWYEHGPIFIKSGFECTNWRFLWAILRAITGGFAFAVFTTRILECLFYCMMKYRQDYIEQGIEYYEKIYKEKQIKSLEKHSKEQGFVLVQ